MEPDLSKKKKFFFILILISGSLMAGIAISEMAVRYRQRIIATSDRQDPGMIRYDRRLGWKLTPNWQGRHRHYDFDVLYQINPYGFRGDFPADPQDDGRLVAVVGDSFTFCLGVDDAKTFVQLLNDDPDSDHRFLNFGVPGYSTDQEYLMIQERLPAFSVDAMFLVVYLGNDLFDNELSWPLQAEHAKPRFVLSADSLVLKNVPVPLEKKPEGKRGEDLARWVVGDKLLSAGRIRQFLNRFQLFRLLTVHVEETPDLSDHFSERFERPLKLFNAIVVEVQQFCFAKNIGLTLVLMPGQSYVRKPASFSGQFQDYLRARVVQMAGTIGVAVIDLAKRLREEYRINPGNWYHPNEGHMTPEGQGVVARIVGAEIARRWQ